MNQNHTVATPKAYAFVFHGALVALGAVGVLYGVFAQREVVAVLGLVLVGLGQLNIGRLQERKEWLSKIEREGHEP